MYRELGPWQRRHRPAFTFFTFHIRVSFFSCFHSGCFKYIAAGMFHPFKRHFLFGIPMLSSDLCPAHRFKSNTRRGSWSGLLLCYGIAYFTRIRSNHAIIGWYYRTKNKKLMLTDSAKRLQNCIREGQGKKKRKKKTLPSKAEPDTARPTTEETPKYRCSSDV